MADSTPRSHGPAPAADAPAPAAVPASTGDAFRLLAELSLAFSEAVTDFDALLGTIARRRLHHPAALRGWSPAHPRGRRSPRPGPARGDPGDHA